MYLGAFGMWFRNSHEPKQPDVLLNTVQVHVRVDSNPDTRYPLQSPREHVVPLHVKF
jgi:hypothetical protein